MIHGLSKVIFTPRTDHLEFYDLEVDLGERDDGSTDARAKRLRGRLREWIEENTVAAIEPSAETLESFGETKKRLKSLGYVR